MKVLSLLISVLIIIGSLYAVPSQAFYQGVPHGSGIGYNAPPQGGSIISAQQAAQIVKNQFGGKVLKVTRGKPASNPSYRVKIVKADGHVLTVTVNGKTGKIVGR